MRLSDRAILLFTLAAMTLIGIGCGDSPTEPRGMTITPGPGDVYTRPTPTPTPAPASASLEGHFVGSPVIIPGITVVVREGSISRSAVTDASGFFRMDGLMPGAANVTYSSPAFGGFDGSLPVVLHQGMNDIDIPIL